MTRVGREIESNSAGIVMVALELETSGVFSPAGTIATDSSVGLFSDLTACPFPPVDDSDSLAVAESLFAIDASQDAVLCSRDPVET